MVCLCRERSDWITRKWMQGGHSCGGSMCWATQICTFIDMCWSLQKVSWLKTYPLKFLLKADSFVFSFFFLSPPIRSRECVITIYGIYCKVNECRTASNSAEAKRFQREIHCVVWQAANLAMIEHPHQQLSATPSSALALQVHHRSLMEVIKKDNQGKELDFE